MEPRTEIQKVLESYVKKGTFQNDEDWRKIPQERNLGSHLAEVTREDVIQILNKYLAGAYPSEGVNTWANGILKHHFTGYIAMESDPVFPLFAIIENLALWGEEDLTPEYARKIIQQLQS